MDCGDPGRRKFFKQVALGSSAALLKAGPAKAGTPVAAAYDGPAFFTDEERAMLATLAEEILPGAASLGAPAYVEQLLTAFEFSPPKIYAGGPSSGRNPFPSGWGGPVVDTGDTFQDFLPLNRHLDAAWRLQIYGTDAAGVPDPNAALLGKVTGLRDLFKQGLQKEIAARKNPFWAWIKKHVIDPVSGLVSDPFESKLIDFVIEGCLANPEYGGNAGLKGWQMANYPGDVAPRGFSYFDESRGGYIEPADHPVTTIDPGPDPAPLGLWNKLIFKGVSIVLGGNPK